MVVLTFVSLVVVAAAPPTDLDGSKAGVESSARDVRQANSQWKAPSESHKMPSVVEKRRPKTRWRRSDSTDSVSPTLKARYTSPDWPLSHLAYWASGGTVFVGGTNVLLALDSNTLSVERSVATGPKLDSPQCHASGCHADVPLVSTDNVNKVSFLRINSGNLISKLKLSYQSVIFLKATVGYGIQTERNVKDLILSITFLSILPNKQVDVVGIK